MFINKNHEGTPRQARVAKTTSKCSRRYIVEYLDTGEEERNVSYKRCKYASFTGNKNDDNWDLISEGFAAKHTVILEGGGKSSDYEKLMECQEPECKTFQHNVKTKRNTILSELIGNIEQMTVINFGMNQQKHY